MKEHEIKEIARLIERRKILKEEYGKVKVESQRPSYQSYVVLEIGKSGLFSNCPVNIHTFVHYLQSEIDSLTEQLKILGVEIE